jgi:hypothetical protein
MRALSSYDYAFLRVVPNQERGEFLNVGVILFCRTQRFLAASIHLDDRLLQLLDPNLDVELLRHQLAIVPEICAGRGPIGVLGQAEAFHWLVAPHNTVMQTSPVHSGLTADPAAELEHLMNTMVRRGQ